MTTLTVGTGGTYATLSAAISVSHDGDVIEVASGTYVNDFSTINTRITIEGVGGMVHLVATIPPPDDKAILTTRTDVTLDNIEFSGAAVASGNGAGIRYEGGALVINDCYFHGNQDGLLAADDPSGSITINNSEFANNGTGDGQTHNLYVGVVGTLTVNGGYFHDVNVGHEIKSRALNNVLENNRIADGPTGTGSYAIDLPNGGNATVQNNVIEKGPNAENSNFISFGEEGDVYPGSTLTVNGNTILNDAARPVVLVHDLSGGTVNITNNMLFGMSTAQTYSGSGTPDQSGNTVLSSEPPFDTSHPFTTMSPVCFVAGTGILTPSGYTAVEDLQPGDLVITLADGARQAKPVRWLGHRCIEPNRHPRPELVSPIRIVRGAIAENVPCRDVLLSPDHALYLDGVLIVARQLINGTTIRRESAKSVRYFHVELDAHAILLADRMPAESYLDTGNRGFFSNAVAPLILHPGPPAGQHGRVAGSCAPFHTDEPTVQLTWHRLARRAADLGFARDASPETTEPELRLLAGGRNLRPISVSHGQWDFVLPAGVTEARLLSRAAVPTDCRPWLDDHRLLGVPVRRVVLRRADTVEEVPLDFPNLRDGWWEVEHRSTGPTRWTNGDALLSLPRTPGPTVLEIHLSGEMTYPLPVRRRA